MKIHFKYNNKTAMISNSIIVMNLCVIYNIYDSSCNCIP